MALQSYIQYSFRASERVDTDTLVAILSDYGFEGFWESENELIAYISEDRDSNLPEWLSVLQSVDSDIQFEKSILAPKNWNEEWEKNYDVVSINEQCEIYASFHKVNPNIKYPIIIDPKMSFGTGHHETTFMMCNLLFEIQNEIQHKKLIDVGCGTGILAILSKKLGVEKVFAIDNDEICIENSLENVEKNISSTDKKYIEIMQGTIQDFRKKYPFESFDIITANIQKDVILNDLKDYKSILNLNGYLLLSGILKEYEKEIIDAAKPLQHILTKYKNDWVAIMFKRIIQ